MSGQYNYTFKILLCGDEGSGKTSLIERFIHGKFSKAYLTTIGVEPYSRYETMDGQKICYSFWDVSGQDRFGVMRSMFFNNVMGAFIVFDLTNRKSFDSVTKWVEEITVKSPNTKFILIGNNNHLSSDVHYKEAVEKAIEIGAIQYLETNSITGEKMANAIRTMGKVLLRERGGGLHPKKLKKNSTRDLESLGREKGDVLQITIQSEMVEILLNHINDRNCCILIQELGDQYCGICGKSIKFKSLQVLSKETAEVILKHRYCCIQSGRKSRGICLFCNRQVPTTYIVMF